MALSPASSGAIAHMGKTVLQLAVASSFYLCGIVFLSRRSLVFEASLSVALPLLVLAAGWAKYPIKRLVQLLIIESFYNLLSVLAKVAVVWEIHSLNTATSIGFALFFAVQLSGFVAYQIKQGKPHGVFQSLTAVALLLMWWLRITDTTNTIDADGRFMMWGEDAPCAVRLYYVAWAVNVLLVDSVMIPWLRQATVQFISVGVAIWTGEFFHVRLLTACHLMLCDIVFGYSHQAPERLGLNFARVPREFEKVYRSHLQPILAWATTLGCIALLFGALLHGPDFK